MGPDGALGSRSRVPIGTTRAFDNVRFFAASERTSLRWKRGSAPTSSANVSAVPFAADHEAGGEARGAGDELAPRLLVAQRPARTGGFPAHPR